MADSLPADLSQATYYKLNSQANNGAGAFQNYLNPEGQPYYTFSLDDTNNDGVRNAGERVQLSLQVTDGDQWDRDGEANGVIVDPGQIGAEYDGVAPTGNFTAGHTTLLADSRSTSLSLVFSEEISSFDPNTSLEVIGGALSDGSFDASNNTFSATFTATGGFSGNGAVRLLDESYVDPAGNLGEAAEVLFNIDTIAPTAALALSSNSLFQTDTSDLTLTFSEAINEQSFDASTDLVVVGGDLSNGSFDASTNSFSATFTAAADFSGEGSITLLGESYTDAAGNPGAGSEAPISIEARNTGSATFAITGNAATDQILTVTTELEDPEGFSAEVSHRWYSSEDGGSTWVDTGHVGDQYATQADQSGWQFKVTSSYSDGQGNPENVESAPISIGDIGDSFETFFTVAPTASLRQGDVSKFELHYGAINDSGESSASTSLEPLTLNVHFDASAVTALAPESNVNGISINHQIIDDNNDLDHDPSTTKILQLNWDSVESQISNQLEVGQTTPAALLRFESLLDEGLDPLSAPFTTQLNYTSPSNSDGYDFLTGSTTLSTFSLDVDGDGDAKLLTDGIMLIRKFIGQADVTDGFGADFFQQAGRYSADQINNRLDIAEQSNLLDFDGDGSTSLFKDGILMMRYLIDSNSLLDSAELIGSGSQFKENPEDLITAFEAITPASIFESSQK